MGRPVRDEQGGFVGNLSDSWEEFIGGDADGGPGPEEPTPAGPESDQPAGSPAAAVTPSD